MKIFNKGTISAIVLLASSTSCLVQAKLRGVHANPNTKANHEGAFTTTTNDKESAAATMASRELQTSHGGLCEFNGEVREPGQWLEGPTQTCLCDRYGSTKWVECVDNKRPRPIPSIDTALGARQEFQAKDFVFDLLGSEPVSITEGGTIQAMTVAQVPSLAGQGLSYALFTIEPCGINLPHMHPRATEMLYVISGKDLRTAFVEENGGRVIVNDIGKGKTTFFPEGLIHYQQNLSCEPAVYLSATNSEDPGVITTMTQFFQLPKEAVAASLNQPPSTVDKLISGLPAGPAEGRLECMKKCGIPSQW